MITKKRIAIVDPFFSGENFCYLAERLGYEVVAIQSIPFAPQPTYPFSHYLIYDGALEKLLHTLRQLNVVALFAGNENGVLLADQLSTALGLISNGVELSLARRDKGVMKKIFNKYGIACAKHASFDRLNPQDITTQFSFPLVLKPTSAFGSMNVMICRNMEELNSACDTLNHQDLSAFGVDQTGFLAEEYIDGEEYCVNVIGNGKQLFVTDIWRYERREYIRGRSAYFSAELLDPVADKKLIGQLVKSSLEAVTALGILYGCSHVEIKVDQQRPYVLEVGARISGGRLVQHAESVTGQSIELCHIKAFLGRDFALQPLYTLNAHTAIVLLRAPEGGVIQEIRGVDLIKKLPSFKEIALKVQVGDKITPTVDLINIPGSVILQCESQKQVARDCTACHELFQLICCKNSARTF